MPRGRPKGAANQVNRAAYHRDCLAIARLRLADPGLKIWPAIFQVTGKPEGRWQDARARRLHRHYEGKETYYTALVRAPVHTARPLGLVALARQIEATWSPILRAHEDTARFVRALRLAEYLVRAFPNIS